MPRRKTGKPQKQQRTIIIECSKTVIKDVSKAIRRVKKTFKMLKAKGKWYQKNVWLCTIKRALKTVTKWEESINGFSIVAEIFEYIHPSLSGN